jgi:hypothetical protein
VVYAVAARVHGVFGQARAMTGAASQCFLKLREI